MDQKKMDRRTFFTKSAGCTVGLTLLAFPGIISEVMATKGDKPTEDIIKELEEKAAKFMPMYRACSSASFAALNEQFNLKAGNAIRPLMPFAGGIGGRGETCGAVSGSILAIGFFFEPSNQTGTKKPGSSNRFGALFFDRFNKAFGSTRCREVVKHQYGRYYDFAKPEDMKLFMEASLKTNKCMEVVKTAVRIAGEIILENS
jgi:C_GCAxxG_C_C family probable redox protein